MEKKEGGKRMRIYIHDLRRIIITSDENLEEKGELSD